MKKTSILQSILFVLALATSSTGTAHSGQENFSYDESSLLALSKEVEPIENADKIAMQKVKLTNTKMYKNFIGSNRNASGIQLISIKTGYIIHCNVNGNRTRVMYNNKGNWINTLASLTEKQIPGSIQKVIENEFPWFDIKGATMVSVLNKTAYLVHIENNKAIKTIRFTDNGYDVYEELIKQR